jgi:hypothetical protein
MDLDQLEPQLSDYIYYIQDAIAKVQMIIVAPAQDKKPRVRANSAFTEELLPLPIRQPPPPQQQQITEAPTDPVPLGWSPSIRKKFNISPCQVLLR